MTEENFHLTIENLSYVVGQEHILNHVNMYSKSSQGLIILGESGQGKTTLIKLLAGLETPTTGRIWYGKTQLNQLNKRERAHFRRQFMGIAFQNAHIVPSLNVTQNLLLATEIHNPDSWDRRDSVREMMERFEIDHRASSYVDTLSGGEIRRVALARAFVNRPKIVLLDEPLSGLDQNRAERITQEIISLKDETGALLVIATHNMKINKACKLKLDLDQLQAEYGNSPQPDLSAADIVKQIVEVPIVEPDENPTLAEVLSVELEPETPPSEPHLLERVPTPPATPEPPKPAVKAKPKGAKRTKPATQTNESRPTAAKPTAKPTAKTSKNAASKSNAKPKTPVKSAAKSAAKTETASRPAKAVTTSQPAGKKPSPSKSSKASSPKLATPSKPEAKPATKTKSTAKAPAKSSPKTAPKAADAKPAKAPASKSKAASATKSKSETSKSAKAEKAKSTTSKAKTAPSKNTQTKSTTNKSTTNKTAASKTNMTKSATKSTAKTGGAKTPVSKPTTTKSANAKTTSAKTTKPKAPTPKTSKSKTPAKGASK